MMKNLNDYIFCTSFFYIRSSTYQLPEYENIELRVHHHSQSKSNQQNHHLNVIKFHSKDKFIKFT